MGAIGGAMPVGGPGTGDAQGGAGVTDGVFARAVSCGLMRSACCNALAERERSRAAPPPGGRDLARASDRFTAAWPFVGAGSRETDDSKLASCAMAAA